MVELELKTGQRLRINNICLLGGALGVASLPIVWVYHPPTMPSPYSPHIYPTVLWWVQQGGLLSSLYLTGVVLSFLSPLGGFLELPLIASSVVVMTESGNETPLDGIDQQVMPMPGFVLGCISAALVIASLLYWRGEKASDSSGLSNSGLRRFLTYRIE